MIHISEFIFNTFQTRCCAVWDDSGKCAVIDPGYCCGQERDSLVSFIESRNLTPVCIMLTHGHFDHIYGVSDLAGTYGIPVYMDKKEEYTIKNTNPHICGSFGLPLPSLPDSSAFREITEGDVIEVGSLRFEVIPAPGHSAGGACFLERECRTLFSGDTLFAGAIGRTDHPGGDYDALINSIFTGLMCLDGDIKVIPGHGPTTDIATERMTNPFLMPFNEPYEQQ